MTGRRLLVAVTVLTMLLAGMSVATAQRQGRARDAGERGERAQQDPAERWQQLLERFDADGDGRITREEWQGAERVFEMLDTDGDGVITEEEAMRLGDRRGQARGERPGGDDQAQRDPAQRWQRMLERFDADGDGRISREEWQGPDERFDRLDANNDGFITEDEVVGAAARDDQQRPARPDPAQTLIRLMDTNGDGRVSEQEWADFFAQADENEDGFLTHAELFKQIEALLRPRPEPVEEQ